MGIILPYLSFRLVRLVFRAPIIGIKMKIFKRAQIAAMTKLSGSLTQTPALAWVYLFAGLNVDPNGMNNAYAFPGSISSTQISPIPLNSSSTSPSISTYGQTISSSPLSIPCYPSETAAILSKLVPTFSAPSASFSDLSETRSIVALGVTRTVRVGVYWEQKYGPRYSRYTLLP